MGLIETATTTVGEWLGGLLPDGILRSFVVDGLVAGVGGVLVFLPQIIVLFFLFCCWRKRAIAACGAAARSRVMGTVGSVGTFVYSVTLELCLRDSGDHGDARCQPARSVGDDFDLRAADDLLGAAAGICLADRCVYSGA